MSGLLIRYNNSGKVQIVSYLVKMMEANATFKCNIVSKTQNSIPTVAMKRILHAICLALLILSCYPRDTEPFAGDKKFDGTGYRPVYKNPEEISKVEVQAARSLSSPGKIYTFDRYLFINELGKGIHIIDNTDPKKPENLSFVSILGNYDIAVKDNWLYADNFSNLLVIDIAEPKVPKVVKSISNVIPVHNYPPLMGVYFECADNKKGVVVDWEKVEMDKQPKCYR